MKSKLRLTAAILLLISTSSVSYAGFNNAALPNWIDAAAIPGNWVFTNTEPDTAKTITGDNNIVLGRFAGGNISGTHNFIVGHTGAGANTTGINNILMGQAAGQNVSGHNNVALGDRAGSGVTGINNFAAGPYEAGTNVTGYYNIAIGNQSGQNVGYAGTIAGLESSNPNTGMGRNNIAIGRLAGNKVQGNENVAIGARVGESVGSAATSNSVGIWNVALGTDGGNRVQGTGNSYIGSQGGNDVLGSYNFTGGYNAGNKVTGNNNVILGSEAGTAIAGSDNVAIGKNAGANTTADVNEAVSIGSSALASKDKVMAIGYKAAASALNTVALGNTATANVEHSVALGDNSATTAVKTASSAGTTTYASETVKTLDGTNLALTFAGGTPTGVVSIGTVTAPRRIQNVSAGLISKTSTDAINGSQLYAVVEKIQTVASTAGKKTVVAQGNNITIAEPIQEATTTTYTVNGMDTQLESADGSVIVSGGAPDANGVRKYDLKITSAEKVDVQGAGTAKVTSSVVNGVKTFTVTGGDTNLTSSDGSVTIGGGTVDSNGVRTFDLKVATAEKVDIKGEGSVAVSSDTKDGVKTFTVKGEQVDVKGAGIISVDTKTVDGVKTFTINADTSSLTPNTTEVKATDLGLEKVMDVKGNSTYTIDAAKVTAEDTTVLVSGGEVTKTENGTKISDYKVKVNADVIATNASVDNKVKVVDTKIIGVDNRVTTLGNQVTNIDNRVTKLGNEVVTIGKQVDTLDGKVTNIDNRVTNLESTIQDFDTSISETAAQGAALSALKPLQYDPLEPTQLMAGVGMYDGSSAVAIGVAHYKNESTLFHAGVSFGGKKALANAGVTWKFGNRDEEQAVPDRYKSGPISSVYVMQDEVAAMKAQNARLLSENKALKNRVDEIESERDIMKSQIQALISKVGL